MFTEILRIKPVLEPASAAAMEAGLTKRFKRVARVFKTGLDFAVKGTILGIGLNILAKILNPIKELEERLDKLLGKGKDTAELADRLGTTGGKVLRIEAIGQRLGVSPEDLQKLMEKYAEAIEKGREEVKGPLKDQSDATKILSKDFLAEKDLAESFLKFVQSAARAPGDQGHKAFKEVLGEDLFGSKKRFAFANFKEELQKGDLQGLPSLDVFQKAFERNANVGKQISLNRANQEINDFIENSNTLSSSTASAIQKLEKNRSDQQNFDFRHLTDKINAGRGVESVTDTVQKTLDGIQIGLGKLVAFTDKLSASRWFRNLAGIK